MSTITNRGIIYAALECPICPGHGLLQTRDMGDHMARHDKKAQLAGEFGGYGTLSECGDCGGPFLQVPGLGSTRCATCRIKHMPSRKGAKGPTGKRGAVESDVSIRQNRKARTRSL